MAGKTLVIDLYVVGLIVGILLAVSALLFVTTGAAGLWSCQYTLLNAEFPVVQEDGSKLTRLTIREMPGFYSKLLLGHEEQFLHYETTHYLKGWTAADSEYKNTLSEGRLGDFYNTWLNEKIKAITPEPSPETITIAQTEEVQPEQTTSPETPVNIFEEAQLLEKTLREMCDLQAQVYVRKANAHSEHYFVVIYSRNRRLKSNDMGYLDRWCGKTVLYRLASDDDSTEEQDF